MANRLQHKIACSRYAFPLTNVYACGIWLFGGLLQHQLWVPFILMLVTTVVMAELNNQHALIRTYSRMLSCSFLIMSASTLPIFFDIESGIIQLCMALTYFYLFKAYQNKMAIGSVFNAFFFIGLASVWFVQAIFLLPLWWLALRFYIVGMSWRTFFASLIGVITPYWFLSGYYIYQDSFELLIEHFMQLCTFGTLAHLNELTHIELITFGFISILGIIGFLYFITNSSKEKIRIRLLFASFALMMISTIAFIILQPVHYPYLLPMLIVSVAPFIGHYLTFSGSRLSAITSLVIVTLTLIITAYQIWMHS